MRDPERPEHWIIKRVSFGGGGEGGVFVLGDNASESRDSRMFGNVALSAIVGRVVMRIAIDRVSAVNYLPT